MSIGYTPWVNALDYTSVVFPVTKVDKNIDTFDDQYRPINEADKQAWQESTCPSGVDRCFKSLTTDS